MSPGEFFDCYLIQSSIEDFHRDSPVDRPGADAVGFFPFDDVGDIICRHFFQLHAQFSPLFSQQLHPGALPGLFIAGGQNAGTDGGTAARAFICFLHIIRHLVCFLQVPGIKR